MPYQLGFAPLRQPAPLRTNSGQRLYLSMDQTYAISASHRASFHASTVAYRFHILDGDEREILAYHWHPSGPSPISEPHLHLSSRVGVIQDARSEHGIALGELHLATGAVTFAQIVRMLIREFGIQPRRSDWENVLTAVELDLMNAG